MASNTYQSSVSLDSHYYPFGMIMPGRSGGEDYRYGFNGKEQDGEVSGTGNQYDYGFRIYNPRLGRFLSVDPLTTAYPMYSPFQFSGNMPIWAIDLDGLEEYIIHEIYRDGRLQSMQIRVLYHSDGTAQDQEVKSGDGAADYTGSKILVRKFDISEGSMKLTEESASEDFTPSQQQVLDREPTSRSVSSTASWIYDQSNLKGKEFETGTYSVYSATFAYPKSMYTTSYDVYEGRAYLVDEEMINSLRAKLEEGNVNKLVIEADEYTKEASTQAGNMIKKELKRLYGDLLRDVDIEVQTSSSGVSGDGLSVKITAESEELK